MIGNLLYLTASRPDLMQAVCATNRFQVNLKESHVLAVKRILRYLKGTLEMGLWYPAMDSVKLQAYTDVDWAGSIDDRKSTNGCSFYLDSKCVAWLSRKQNSVALSTAKVEYMAACAACIQVIWMLR